MRNVYMVMRSDEWYLEHTSESRQDYVQTNKESMVEQYQRLYDTAKAKYEQCQSDIVSAKKAEKQAYNRMEEAKRSYEKAKSKRIEISNDIYKKRTERTGSKSVYGGLLG